jgi:hypothetical protein
MGQTGTVPVSAPIDTYALSNTYPTHKANRGKGGYMTTDNLTTLAAISADRREKNMCVFVDSEGKEYRLQADLTTWVVAAPTGIDPSDLMLKSQYDPNDDGVVTNSDQLGGQVGSYYLSRTNHTGTQAISTVTGLQAALDAKVDDSQVGVSVASLVAGTVPVGQLPFSSTAYLGSYNANTNTPTLTNGFGTAGEWYWCNVSGSAGPQGATTSGQAVVYNGSIWETASTVTGSIISVNGQTSSAVVLDLDDIADTASRAAVSPDEAAGIAASPNPVTASNPVATQADLTSLIVVGNGYFLPELFANGHTLGDGTLRLLNTLTNPATGVAYTNLSAGAVWTRVNSAYTINVTTMSIDWIAWQEAMLAMAQDGYSKISSPGGRGYCPSQSIVLPFDQTAVSQYRRSKKFIFDLAGSVMANRSSTNFQIFDKYPANQAQANGLQLDYAYKFMDGTFIGRGTNADADCAIRLGGTSGSTLENINFESLGIGADFQFCLQASVIGCEVTDFGKYGVTLRDGLWSGAGANIAQSNNNVIQQFRSYSGSGKTPTAAIYLNGNRNTWINTAGFEGSNGCEHQIFYDYNGATTVKNLLNLENIDFENAGASRAGVRVRSNSGQILWRAFNTQVSAANMAVLLEAEEAGQPNTNPIGVALEWSAYNNNPGWKLRNVGNPKWYIYNNEMNDNGSIFSAANWDTANGGTIPSPGQVRYQAKL